MDIKKNIKKTLDESAHQFIDISHQIHSHPELAFNEKKSCQLLINILKNNQFTMIENYCDLETAFHATYGDGPLHIAICAEYDALPEIGHACGHNIIAAAGIGAAIILKDFIADLGITLHVMGTPAEEAGGGKIILLERGGFKNIHAAMMVHPGPFDEIFPKIIAASLLKITFLGKEAHAAAYPEKGINAADALTISQVAIGLLRQHLSADERVHGIITKGGDAPNIIPAETKADYIIRSDNLEKLLQLKEKILRCFQGAAIATGSKLEIEEMCQPYADMIHHQEIAKIYQKNAEILGKKFNMHNKPFTASTDMGNISQVIPSIHPIIGIHSSPYSNHQKEFTEACISEEASLAMLDGALAMAWTIVDVAQNEKLREKLINSLCT